ncbi:10966_t:CDS:2 [Funneliformis mosseae]|uniref:10966_t:CDS:1 n=1 Tax=Funneliformis mosseae TaxID=27381 RepID=A0A9N9BSI4_FUNMO|nr:10966_t:CDS:2 [Funneliformis mosseae]
MLLTKATTLICAITSSVNASPIQSEIVENPELEVRGPSRGRGRGHCKNHCKGRHGKK